MINLCSTTGAEANGSAVRDWQWQAQHCITQVADLCRHIKLSRSDLEKVSRAVQTYPFSITPYYLGLAQENSLHDPILRQCLPGAGELRTYPGEDADPFGEANHMPIPGLIRRYPDRALLLINTRCPVLCRHCFRKRLWQCTSAAGPVPPLQEVLEYLSEHPEIREVILSGGDPLMLDDRQLQAILGSLHEIKSVEMVRIATRLPATLPQRFTPELTGLLAAFKPVWIAAHFNHPRELTPQSTGACRRLVEAGMPIVSQTILLKGVNDDAATLRSLFIGLLRCRVKPYYLFHGDPAAGAMHFRVSKERGRAIMRELRETTSGLAIPTYAADTAGAPFKMPLV